MTLRRTLILMGAVSLGLLVLFMRSDETRSDFVEGFREGYDATGEAGGTRLAGAVAEEWDDADWEVFHGTVAWALENELHTRPLGDAMVRIGERWVGTPYVPGTLDPEGPERLVIDFQGMDCVTFVENVLATALFVKQVGGTSDAVSWHADRGVTEDRYETLLESIRYRGGERRGYPSRLHYFSEWIADNAVRGHVRDVTRELGGVEDTEPVDFMTTHRDAYRQLADDEMLSAIAEAETRLSAAGRWYIPQDAIAQVADGIRDGDIIAATSSVPGLDVAHTGLAIRRNGALHLMHAPLVGDSVEISERPLPQRILRISGQDGIMVARPLEPAAGPGATR